MNRSDFQRLAELRLTEGKALLDAGHYAGAYYLLGYAAECALKACIAKKTRRYDFPPERKDYEEIYTHDLVKLLKQSGQEIAFQKACKTDRILDQNWTTVKDWKETSRYDLNISSSRSRDLYVALNQNSHGVLKWLKKWW